jgi:hypothetical protein
MTPKVKLSILAALAVTVLVAGAPTGLAGPSPSGPCNVPGGVGADGVRPAFAMPADGRLVTTLLADGEKECRLLRRDGTLYARAVQDALSRPYQIDYFNGEGRILLRYNLDYGESADDDSDGGDAGGGNGCGSTARSLENISWAFSPIGWRWNKNSFDPEDTNLDSTLQALRNAHITWEGNDNPCGVADNSSLNFTYQGTTNQGANNVDGISTIDHGEVANLSSCSGCIATERTRFSVTTGEVVESDIRFDDDVNWTNSPGSQPNQRDVESAAAHEVGHTALLNHVSGSNAAGLTMTSGTPPGTSWRRNLGEGDALGNNSKH